MLRSRIFLSTVRPRRTFHDKHTIVANRPPVSFFNQILGGQKAQDVQAVVGGHDDHSPTSLTCGGLRLLGRTPDRQNYQTSYLLHLFEMNQHERNSQTAVKDICSLLDPCLMCLVSFKGLMGKENLAHHDWKLLACLIVPRGKDIGHKGCLLTDREMRSSNWHAMLQQQWSLVNNNSDHPN